jgi:hypothetical protein
MDDHAPPETALHAAIVKLLRPLFRVLLRHRMSFGAFEELAKRAYVDVALNDFGIPGKKPSISRASILSGLTRKEVQRIVSAPPEGDTTIGERYNRAARVLAGWLRDATFHGANGKPMPLDVDGEISFAALVRRHSGDMPARAMLDELERVGAVRRRADGRIELRTRAYVPKGSAADKLAILGSDVADLIATIDHNLVHDLGGREEGLRFQRKVMYHSMPADALPAFRKLSAQRAQALLEALDRWLAAHDIDNPPDQPESPRARIGLGIYYFEERLDAPTPPPSTRTRGDSR